MTEYICKDCNGKQYTSVINCTKPCIYCGSKYVKRSEPNGQTILPSKKDK